MVIPLALVINGINGKMGQALQAVLPEYKHIQLVDGISYHATNSTVAISNNYLSSFNELTQQPGIVIDFSWPGGFDKAINYCLSSNIPLLSGTTDLSAAQQQSLQKLSRTAPVFYAANMSRGVALINKLVALLAKQLGFSAEIDIIETHHHSKKDAPSGTALALANTIASARNQKASESVALSHIGPRSKHAIYTSSIRRGDIIGEHKIIFTLQGEQIEITHQANSRNLFAHGALTAAKWLIEQQPGMYGMDDLFH